ncbi:MAG TPA: TspO/MBR family protein [Kiloniellales bacterium]|jgi:benzodiazapine receptor|nr:TspO/MBR family protein [Kiloniellales bacterium]
MKRRSGGFSSLLLFLVLVVGGGLVIGTLTAPDAWYRALNKPTFNPPGWVFGPVWTVLYVLIAVAGWRLWRRNRIGSGLKDGSLSMRLWWLQLALNFGWSPLFFSAHLLGLAFLVVALLLLAIIAFIVTTWRQDRIASFLFMPYAAWVAFATALNGAIWLLN